MNNTNEQGNSEEQYQQQVMEMAEQERQKLEQATPEELLQYISELAAHIHYAYRHLVTVATISSNALEKIESLEKELEQYKQQTVDIRVLPMAGVVGVS